ncbi:MAG: ATP-binding protein, partial [Wenzhouxiangellaceae bacterium]
STEFVAVETASGLRHAPETLSTATRMQLLLALRMSWAEHQERGRKALPLILDEALTTSDAERFAAVVQSLEQLVADEGRQVIYLAAGAHELALWREISGHAPAHIDLGALRAGHAAVDFRLAESPRAPSLPAPGDQDAETYARALGVPALDPRQPASAQHLFWILDDDLELLHRLLEAWRLSHVGELEHLLNGQAATAAVSDSEQRERLEARIELIDHWTDAWRIGRGRPVQRGDLELADGITERTVNEVDALARSLDGEAEPLLEALEQGEVKYFKQAQRERLRQWMLDHGLLDTRSILDAGQRRKRVLQRMVARLKPSEIHARIDLLERAIAGPRPAGNVKPDAAAAGAPGTDR